jgi:hypothetical protein
MAYRIGEHGVSQASLVIIRHAPRIVHAASHATMTQTAAVADSGSRVPQTKVVVLTTYADDRSVIDARRRPDMPVTARSLSAC